jgi:hypothetical protein
MTPHSAVLVTLAAYLHKGGSGSSFKIELSGYRRATYYIKSAGGNQWKTTKQGSGWSCTCTMEIIGDKATIRNHKHHEYTPFQEIAYFSASSISGSVEGSKHGFNGSFSGRYERNDGSKMNLSGNKGTYQTELSKY